MSWHEFGNYTPTKPRRVDGGIKSTAKSGDKWWSSRWYDFMDTFRLGARLARGRAYARKGQVVDVSIKPGIVNALVQGSRVKPYKVTIEFEQITPDGWRRILERIKEQALFLSSLLSGEVPTELEEFFRLEGSSLFPTLKNEYDMRCGCPDYSVPCKHIAAVFYVLGDAFDGDPFLILSLRGMSHDKLLESIGGKSEAADVEISDISEPLPTGDEFYSGLPLPDDVIGPLPQVSLPRKAVKQKSDFEPPILKMFGKFPFWKGERSLSESLGSIYKSAAPKGRAIALGELLENRETDDQ
ncbi:MAG: SWIM zinc finger family protein [Synergistaceae bacterium]|jgi:uncharacterized Zn finger protein|nr:SWIM zinc finger family protein [Synergistaceae bacterium]